MKIVNKDDTDYIFSLNRAGWESYAQRMVYPEGWEVGLAPHDTGTGVMAFNPSTGFGLSVQPLYDDDKDLPTILIVGSYYPANTLPSFIDDFKKNIEKEAANDLGSSYSVSASYIQIPPYEGIELMISKMGVSNAES